MTKVFISFLGTNNYLPCNYYYQQQDVKVDNIRFVQEGIVQLCCGEWQAEDRLLFFLTEEAEQKNWQDDRHQAKDGSIIQQAGLASRIQALKLAAQIEKHPIANGFNSQEVWQIFEVVFAQLRAGDEVIFDITNAFRSIPMLGTVLMNYAKSLKGISILNIFYGAFEALGPVYKVRELPVTDRNVEIVSLKSLSVLQDWTNAANEFIYSGRTKAIEELIQEETLKEIIQNPDARTIRDFQTFAFALEKMSLAMSTVRGNDIMKGSIFRFVDKIVEQLMDKQFIAPLQPILERIQAKTTQFREYSKHEVHNTFKVIEWCIETNLIQQGLTLLQEAIITYVMIYFKPISKMDYKVYAHRSLVKNAIVNASKWKEDVGEQHQSPKNWSRIKPLYDHEIGIFEAFESLLKGLKNFRNDLNHAGFSHHAEKSEQFQQNLNQYFIETKTILNHYPIQL